MVKVDRIAVNETRTVQVTTTGPGSSNSTVRTNATRSKVVEADGTPRWYYTHERSFVASEWEIEFVTRGGDQPLLTALWAGGTSDTLSAGGKFPTPAACLTDCTAFSDTTWQPSYFGGIDRGTVVAVTNGTAPLSGNFRLSYAGRAWEDEAVTEPISVFATPGQVKAAVEALPTLGSNSVIVTRSKDKSPQAELAWSITFVPSAGASGGASNG